MSEDNSATQPTSPDFAKEIADLRAELENWKNFSRQHENAYKELKKENFVKDILSENGLPEEARTFLTASKEEDLRKQAETFKAIIAATKGNSEPVAKTEPASEPKVEDVQLVTNQEPAEVKTLVVNPLQGVSSDTPTDPWAAIYDEVGSLFDDK